MAESPQRHIPTRTCISCGEKRSKKELIRLTLDSEGMVVWDDSGKGQGRGAYVCRTRPCLERMEKGDRLKRAFRKKGLIALHPEFLIAVGEGKKSIAEE